MKMNDDERFWCRWAEKALGKALCGKSVIPDAELVALGKGPGAAGTTARRLLNNLGRFEGAKYLEVGLWRGSTFFAALYGNKLEAIGVDNWSQNFGCKNFVGRTEFFRLLDKYTGRNKIKIIERNIFNPKTLAEIGTGVNIYYYDADHSEKAQYHAFTKLKNVFAKVFIALIDDYTYEGVHRGTVRALKELKYKILMDVRLGTGYPALVDFKNWWNGYRLVVLSKGN